MPDVILPNCVRASLNLVEVLSEADIVFVTLPSRFIEQVMAPVSSVVKPDLALVNMSKGLFAGSGKTSFELLAELFPDNPKAMLSGPTLAAEFTAHIPTAIVVASDNRNVKKQVTQLLTSNCFSVVESDDVIGVELGGILKNIYAMGLGIFNAQGVTGLNFIGAYLTQALAEMTTFGLALGAAPQSFSGLSGMGDLITTAMSDQSHNFKFGRLIGQGNTVAEVCEQIGLLPEGYNALKVALPLSIQHGVELPLANIIKGLIEQSVQPDEALRQFSKLFGD